jgi:hypothetical protein
MQSRAKTGKTRNGAVLLLYTVLYVFPPQPTTPTKKVGCIGNCVRCILAITGFILALFQPLQQDNLSAGNPISFEQFFNKRTTQRFILQQDEMLSSPFIIYYWSVLFINWNTEHC